MWRYFFLFIFVGIESLQASDPKEAYWQEGVVLLLSDEVITGRFSVNLRHQLVIRKKDQGTEIIPIHHIRSFRLYDEEKNILRKYKVLEEKQARGSLKRIFEVVINGKVEVVRKRNSNLVAPGGQKYMAHPAIDLSEEAFSYDYFILHDENIVPLLKFRKKVMPQFSAQERLSVERFMKEKKLFSSNAADIIVILKFYNQLPCTAQQLVTIHDPDLLPGR